VPRPTRSAALLLLLAVILELIGRLIKSTGVTLAAAAALGAVIADGALSPRVDGFTVRREIADRLTAGVATTLRITIGTPPGRRGNRRPVVVVHRQPGLPESRVVTPVMPGDSVAVASVTTTPPQRGVWVDGGSVAVEAYSPLGGFVRRRKLALGGAVWVHPAPAPAYRLPQLPTGAVRGTSPTARAGGGNDFFGIREWRVGDAATAVHWKASARRNQLVVMERERPSHSGLLIVCGRAGDNRGWEPAVARAAATAVGAFRSGRTLVLLGAGEVLSPVSPQEILDFFARLPADSTPSAAAIAAATRAVGGAATVVWLAAEAPSAGAVAKLQMPGGLIVSPLTRDASS
jgi:uncharacterized protein (DUF58 family)